MEEPLIFTQDNAGPTPVPCTKQCSGRLMVRSPLSQGEDRGSIPRQSTKQIHLWCNGSTAPPQVESQVMLALYGKANASSNLAEWY